MTFDGEIKDPEVPKKSSYDLLGLITSKIDQILSEPTDTGDVVQALKEIQTTLDNIYRGSTLLDTDRIPFIISGNIESDDTNIEVVAAKADHRIIVTNFMGYIYEASPTSSRPILPSELKLADSSDSSYPYQSFFFRIFSGKQSDIHFSKPFSCRLGLPLLVTSTNSGSAFHVNWGGSRSVCRYNFFGYWERN